jgi:hypothetical protein
MWICAVDWQALGVFAQAAGVFAQAAAILITGLAAVCGALKIGKSHARILARQARIQSNQFNLENQRFKHERFELRYSFYDLFNRYIQAMRIHGPESEIAIELEMDFNQQYRKARFLFPRTLSEVIDPIIKSTHDYADKRDELRRATSELERKDIREQLTPLRKELYAAYDRFDDRMAALLQSGED